MDLINEELIKLEQLVEENENLLLAQDDKQKEGLEKRKQFLLRKKMEEVRLRRQHPVQAGRGMGRFQVLVSDR